MLSLAPFPSSMDDIIVNVSKMFMYVYLGSMNNTNSEEASCLAQWSRIAMDNLSLPLILKNSLW